MPSPARPDALVLDLDTRAGLCIARSLAGAGLRICVASRDGRASGLESRYAGTQVVLPDPETDFDRHLSALLAALEAEPAEVTIPSIDSSVEVLHRNRDLIGRLTAPALGSYEAVEIALSKERTLEVARGLDIPVPRSILVSTPAELEAAVAETGTPCVLKPVTSWRPVGAGGERVAPLYASDAEQARRIGESFVRADAPLLVQELVGGSRETIKLFRADGVTYARLAMVITRTWPPLGGSSVMRETIDPPPDTLGFAEKLVAEIGLDGYSEAEFRRDGRGRPLLMEINPRLSQSVEVATRAGIDFPRMQLEWARGGTITAATTPRTGIRVGWLAGDLRIVVGALTGSAPPRPRLVSSLRSIASDYLLHQAKLEGFSLRDPRPVLGGIGFACKALFRRKSL